jgi:membrane protein
MIWLYLNWVILLMGAQVSFYHQHPHLLTRRKEPGPLSGGFSERKALLFMFYIGYNFYHGREPWNLNSLVAHLGFEIEQAEQMIDALTKKKLITKTADDPPAFLPARAPDTIYLKDVLDAVRLPVREEVKSREEFGAIEEVTGIAEKIEKAIADSLEKTTLTDIVLHHTKEIPS